MSSRIQGAIDLTTSFQQIYAPTGNQATGQLVVTALDPINTVNIEIVEYDGTNYWPKLTDFDLSRGQAEILPAAIGSGQRVYARVRAAPADLTISAITQADPGVITVNSTAGLRQNWDTFVRIAGVVGMTEVNGLARVQYVNSTTVNLLDELAGNEDTTGFGTYTSGGTISIIPAVVTLIAYEESA